jgi:hypothetical protein
VTQSSRSQNAATLTILAMNQKLTRIIRRIALAGVWATIVLAIAAPLFESTLYWKIPVEPGEPAGFGDVLVLLLFFATAVSFWIAIGLSMILMVGSWKEHRTVSAKYMGAAVAAVVIYYILSVSLPKMM